MSSQLKNLLVCVCIYHIFSIPSWIRSTRTPCDVRCVFSCVNTDLLRAMKNTVGLSVCEFHCVCVFRTDSGVATEPIWAVDLSRNTLCKWNLPVQKVDSPSALCTPQSILIMLDIFYRHGPRTADQRREAERFIHYPLLSMTLVMWRNPGCACVLLCYQRKFLYTSWTNWFCWQIITEL